MAIQSSFWFGEIFWCNYIAAYIVAFMELFKLIFNNGEIRETNLEPLIGDYVSLKNIQTARIDPEWGCLEFNAGMVDIEPNTLYLHII